MAGRADIAACAALAAVLGICAVPSYLEYGNVFDEGSLLAFGLRVLDGDLPHRDFVTFYGPGGSFLMAGVFSVFEPTQAVERTVGLGYQALIAFSLFVLLRPFGRLPAVLSAVVAVLLMAPYHLEATASLGGLGFALAAAACLARGTRRSALAAGVLASAAILLRWDFALPAALAAAPLLARAGRDERRRFAAGLLVAAAGYAAHLAAVGADDAMSVLRDVRASGPGRRLPIDLMDVEAGRLLGRAAVAWAACAAWVAANRRDPRAMRVAALLGLAAGLLPFALSRLDYPHVVPALTVSIAALPCVVASVAGALHRPRWGPAAGAATAVCLALATGAAARQALRTHLEEHARVLVGIDEPRGRLIRVEDRSFRVLKGSNARHVEAVVRAAEAARESGARTLFVGPRNLKRSNINDVFLYYLLSEYEPASRYMELNPRTANRAGSGLADDLRGADVLILNRLWDSFAEPNESQVDGPSEPNLVVERHFCRLTTAGTFEVLRRCR